MQRRITPHLPTRYVTTGHFREGLSYYCYRPNGTLDWLIVMTLAGGGRFNHADGKGALAVRANDLMLMRPGTYAAYETDPDIGQWEMLWAHFQPRPHWLPWLEWPESVAGLMHLTPPDPGSVQRVHDALREVHLLATGALPQRHLFALNALERALLWCELVNPKRQRAWLDERVQAAMDYLCQHMTDKVGLDDVAEASGLSVSHLCELFRRQVGFSPYQFLETQRLERAKSLLETTSHSVQSIAAQVGYANPFHFTLRFKRYTGYSPREFRKRMT